MKNAMRLSLVAMLAVVFAACSGNKKNDEMMGGEDLNAPTTVAVTVEDTPVVVDIQNTEISLSRVHFALDRYNITEANKTILANNAQVIKSKLAQSKLKVVVEGHADVRGTIAYNLALGDKRATEVKNYYVKLGIPAASMDTVTYGKESPLCLEMTEKCHAQNRRAETILRVNTPPAATTGTASATPGTAK